MADKSGVFNGLTVGLTGTTKKGQPYTIYNANILFPSGKGFKLNIPSWSDMYQDIKDLPVGTGIKYEVDDRNNLTEYKITAPVGTTTPPAPTPPVFHPAPAVFVPAPAPVERVPQSIFGYTDRDLKVKAVELAVDFFKGTGTQKEKMAGEELVYAMAKRVFDFVAGPKEKPQVSTPQDVPMGTEFGQPPITDDDIPF